MKRPYSIFLHLLILLALSACGVTTPSPSPTPSPTATTQPSRLPDPDLNRLNLGYRLAYKLAGAFGMVRRAHRIVYYQLGNFDAPLRA
jgi:hypothetical protein